MKSSQCHSFVEICSKILPATLLLLLIALSTNCANESGPTPTNSLVDDSQRTANNAGESLTCPSCELVEVIEIIDANSVRTSSGDISMYGAYVVDQPADCAVLAQERLTTLAGSSIRIEPGPSNTIRSQPNHYYLYKSDGRSIEESLVKEGLALTWTQDGQHLGWFIFQGNAAKTKEAGCLWKGYSAFQRGDPSEFRIPGLTSRDSE